MHIRFQLYAKRVSGSRREACVKYTTGLVHSQGQVSLTLDLHSSYSVAGFYGSVTSSFSLLLLLLLLTFHVFMGVYVAVGFTFRNDLVAVLILSCCL